MTEEDRERATDLGAKATAILTDALAPLMSKQGIAGVVVVAMVSLDDSKGFPVVVNLGVGQGPILAARRAMTRLSTSEEVDIIQLEPITIAMPAKN